MLIETTRTEGYAYTRVEVEEGKYPILGLGDLHYGSPHCNIAEVRRAVTWIGEKKALWIGMGDFMEMATRNSVGAGVYEQIVKPNQQIDDLVSILEPIKDTCITLIKGNHEERLYKDDGVDPMMIIAKELEVSYSGWEAWGIVSNKDMGYTFYAVHGASGHKNAALLLNKMDRDMRKFITTDLIFRAHSHDRGALPFEVYDVLPNTRSVRKREQWMVGTGHFLERADSYVAGKGDGPKPIGTLAMWMDLSRARNRVLRPEYV